MPVGWTSTAGSGTLGIGEGGSRFGEQYIRIGPGEEITQDLDYILVEGEQLSLRYDSSRVAGYGRRIQLLAKDGGDYHLLAETTEQGGAPRGPPLN